MSHSADTAVQTTEAGPMLTAHEVGEPGPGEVRLRTVAALVTGLERSVAAGLGLFRGVPGHACVGVVEATGAGVDPELVGRRVVPAPIERCGTCDHCRGGLGDHCRVRRVLGVEGRDGGLASRVITSATTLAAVPGDLADEVAVFAAPLGAALQCRRQVPVAGKRYVSILGDGTMGLLLGQVLAPLNDSVRVLGRHTERFGRCERWGIRHRHVDDVGRRADQDIVIECTGRPEGLELAALLSRPRGTIVLKSLCSLGTRLAPGADLSPLTLGERTVVGSFLGPVDEALRLLAAGAVDVAPLAIRRMGLEAAERDLAGPRRPGSDATLVMIRGD